MGEIARILAADADEARVAGGAQVKAMGKGGLAGEGAQAIDADLGGVKQTRSISGRGDEPLVAVVVVDEVGRLMQECEAGFDEPSGR